MQTLLFENMQLLYLLRWRARQAGRLDQAGVTLHSG
jgi:hypothetical protein